VNTCVVTETATYQVSQFNSAALTSSVVPQCVTNSPVNLFNIVQSTVTGAWSGPGIAGQLFVPSQLLGGSYTLTYNTTSSPNPTVCPDQNTISVSVTNTVTPVVTSVAPFCTRDPQFNMTVTPGPGIWSGNPAISVNGVMTPSLGSPAANTVTVSVAIGPCVNVGFASFNINQFNTAAFSGTVPNLCGTGAAFNLMGIVQSSVNGTWWSPQPGAIISNSFHPGGLVTNTYALTYSTTSSPNPTLCADIRTIAVNVLNPPIPMITTAGPFCSKDDAYQMSVTPNIGYWTNTSYITSTGMLTPSMCVIGNNPVQYVIGTPTCNSQQTKYVNIEAFNPASLTRKVDDMCNTGSPVNLLPYTLTNMGVWSGPGVTGTNFNPSTVGSGTFVLTYNTSSYPSGLCPDQSTVAVSVYSLASPVITPIGRKCNSEKPVAIQVTPIGGLFSGVNNNAVSVKGLFNPGTAMIGDNIITYSITVGPCVAYGQTTISVEKFLSADIVTYPKATFCKGVDEPINMDQFVANRGGTWAGPGISGNRFDPDMANIGRNNVVVYEILSQPTGLCRDTSSLRLVVDKVPVVVPKASNTNNCAPLEVVFNIPDQDGGVATWTFGDGSDPKQDPVASHVYTTPGTYTATVSYISPLGCVGKPVTVAPFIKVQEAPVPDFSLPEEIFISDPQVQLTNLTAALNSNFYQWKLEGATNPNSTDVNPVATYGKIGRYNVTLIATAATSASGCKAEITKSFEVKNDFNIFIPSSFSPNGDGLNDIFAPVFSSYGLDTKTFEMEIFDRWGHSLYRTKDASKGWDGSVNNKGAQELKEEVYIYKIKYKDMDGNLYNKMGHLSLLK
jgi:gliding motility-associated-like protein